MPRPIIRRRIAGIPEITCFVPSDEVDTHGLENVLKLEELEAIRLKDLEGLEQVDCAIRMAVSRPTFQRILLSAREKVADSLLHGKAIRIEGGVYVQIGEGRGYCRRCGRSWELPPAAVGDGRESVASNDPPDPVQDPSASASALCPECTAACDGPGCGGGGPGRGRGGRGVGRHRRGT